MSKNIRSLGIWVALAFAASPLAADAADLPDEHISDLEILLSRSGTGEIMAAQSRLREVLQTPGKLGEDLAQHIINRVAEVRRPPEFAFHLLSARAYKLDDDQKITPHLDGPYLKKLAMMSVPDDANHRVFRDYRPVVAYLKLHPEDRGEIYWRLRLAATRDGKVSRYPKEVRLLEETGHPDLSAIRASLLEQFPKPVSVYSFHEAWDILLQLEVLQPGMTVEDAEKILGDRFRKDRPEEDPERWIRWYHDTPRHVNPCLNAEVIDGKIVSFYRGNA